MQSPGYGVCRWLAAIVAVLCLVATARCWARMGKDWRMAVAVGEKTNLITDGPFRRIRHPIYAFSILLMICTAIVVPTLPMLAVAVAHIVVDEREGAQRGAPPAADAAATTMRGTCSGPEGSFHADLDRRQTATRPRVAIMTAGSRATRRRHDCRIEWRCAFAGLSSLCAAGGCARRRRSGATAASAGRSRRSRRRSRSTARA